MIFYALKILVQEKQNLKIYYKSDTIPFYSEYYFI